MEFAPRFYYNSFYIIQKVLGHHINYYFECLWEYNKMNKEIKQKQFNLKLILLHRLKQFQDLQFVSWRVRRCHWYAEYIFQHDLSFHSRYVVITSSGSFSLLEVEYETWNITHGMTYDR